MNNRSLVANHPGLQSDLIWSVCNSGENGFRSQRVLGLKVGAPVSSLENTRPFTDLKLSLCPLLHLQ